MLFFPMEPHIIVSYSHKFFYIIGVTNYLRNVDMFCFFKKFEVRACFVVEVGVFREIIVKDFLKP